MKAKFFTQILAIITCLIANLTVIADDSAPYLYILGVAQDAGYPQTGCYEAHCLPGWQDASRRRNPVSLGLIDPGNHKKYMFEATPGFPAQLYELEMEAPSGQYELAGIFLTHAHIGHYTGLMFLGHEAMDYALIDATFFADGELPGRDMSKVPHPFVTESMTLSGDLPITEHNKVWFIHMNHTNPLLRAESKESKSVQSRGFNIAFEGIRLIL